MHTTLERCRRDMRAALAGLSAGEADASPNGRWPIAGIVEHLNRTYLATIEGLEHRLRTGVPAARRITLRQHVVRLVITRLGYFPTGYPAPAAVQPEGRRFVEVAAVFEPRLLVLDQRLKDAARAFGTRTPILNHPILGPFSVADWRRFHRAHTRHHLKQIRACRPRPSRA